jgi:hypothetical protein
MVYIYVFLFSLFKEADTIPDYIALKYCIIIEQPYGESGEENTCDLI